MEAFTSGRVSPAASRAYLASHPTFPADWFERVRGGYRMFGWESQISMARACGRGVASARGRAPHRFDVEKDPAPA